MAEGHGVGHSRELDETPTWAVASVCAVIILISILMEKGLHHLGEWFTERHKKAMFEALEKIKGELMVLGFISLILTFGQNYIIQICIPEKAADTMLPCRKEEKPEIGGGEGKGEHAGGGGKGGEAHHRRLLWDTLMVIYSNRRQLAESSAPNCHRGKVPLISLHGLHQLHIFIFFLAIFHVLYSALTMTLGREKISSWKEWEKETLSADYEFSNDPARFRLSHETSFVRQHSSIWNKVPFIFYIVSFFRQFFRSVRKADYLAMRHGFITVHLAPGSKFDFQKYIKRSLEDDFKVIVGISPLLWLSAVMFLLLNVKGWHTLFWIAVIPLITILSVGTKLQAIITRMALEIKERHAVVQGIPLVQLSDHHFWFGRPQFILFLIHFTLFQNAFQLIYFIWIWYEFGLNSCFHDSSNAMIARLCLGVIVQVLCSYTTLPLYALVSQMGSQMKISIFDEQTSKAIKKWHQTAMKKKNPKGSPNASPPGSPKAVAMHPIHDPTSAVAATVASTSAVASKDILSGTTELQLLAVERVKEEYQIIDLS
ncbi:MLO-like protein 9 isoform X1 [Zingiber officinale]|uniref:MLO-like protein 9 isoform X1 n=2 Tax=Zingiber officinale TaxID=94328 RepID=UPI001C4B26FE|nr:MLO-like protein 9 isoform X1 [Zingiber officinale]